MAYEDLIRHKTNDQLLEMLAENKQRQGELTREHIERGQTYANLFLTSKRKEETIIRAMLQERCLDPERGHR